MKVIVSTLSRLEMTLLMTDDDISNRLLPDAQSGYI